VFLHLLERPLHNFFKCNIVDKATFQQNRVRDGDQGRFVTSVEYDVT